MMKVTISTRRFLFALPLLTLFLFGPGELSSQEPAKKFIREPGLYPLDNLGSSVEITGDAQKGIYITIKHVYKDNTGTTRSSVKLYEQRPYAMGTQWFVFLESPLRLWLFNGKDKLDLAIQDHRSLKKMRPVKLPECKDCPAEVTAALPAGLRAVK
jgi:hypothetical protein